MDKQKPTAELINIIKELHYDSTTGGSSSGNTDERDKIIRRVDTQFSDCDARIDKYIRNSSKDLTRLIKVFNDIAKKIESSRASVKQSRDALKQCKVLLQSKRDDVRRLWLEWCEQRFYYDNLVKLKRLYTASEQIRMLSAEKSFLKAAELVGDATRLVETEFRDINGLNEIKRHLDEERMKLEKHLLSELAEQLYTNVTRTVLESGTGNALQSAGSGSGSARLFYRNYQSDNDVVTKNSGASSEAVIQAIVQSAAKLNSVENNNSILDKMITDINKDMLNQLVVMINSTSHHVVESNLIGNISHSHRRYQSAIENNPKYLSQLIELVFEQFRITARLYKHLTEFSNKTSGNNTVRYQSGFVWFHVQNVLVQLLEEYLDTRQTNQAQATTQELLDKLDINSFFARKRLLNLAFGGDSGVPSNANTLQAATNSALASNNSSNNLFTADDGQRRMFTFKGSSHAMSINSYIREQNNEDLFTSPDVDYDEAKLKAASQSALSPSSDQRVFKILVCQPDHRNITTIFATMEHIVKDITEESRSSGAGGSERLEPTLEKFLQDFILNKFIMNAVESIKENARIHSSGGVSGSGSGGSTLNNSKGRNNSLDSLNIYDISKQLISLQKQKELGLSRPILENILLVFYSCMDLFNLIKDMNSYASEFTQAMYTLIEKHSTYCNQLLFSIVSSSSGDTNYVYSMIWVQDEAIKTYFKQLPAFASAVKNRLTPAAQLAVGAKYQQNNLVLSGLHSNIQSDSTRISTATTNLNSQNPAVLAAQIEMEQVNVELLSKECKTLVGNLNDVNKDLGEGDIITNYNYIEMIAHLYESSDWLIVQLKFILNSLEQMVKNPKTLNNSLSLNELNRLVKLMDDLDKWRGDTLLLLYLEIRVHCFFHLMNFIRQDNTLGNLYSGDVDTDPDECVLNMNRDLHRIYEHLARSLQESKVNYIFDGLGFMIASIFIRAMSNFKKISTHGIAKMCRNIFHVEQNLSAIRTKSDPHLMKAHRFYELLYKKPEELVNHLLEHEAEFQLNDYVNLLNLIYRSQPGYEINSLSENVQALTNILKNKH